VHSIQISRATLAVLLLVTVTFGPSAQKATQSSSAPKAPKQLPADLKDFFIGEWSGAGELSNGKKIEADVSFSADLDNQWLSYSHTDRVPNKYKPAGCGDLTESRENL
jgi:hypothetical protein